MKFFRSPIFIFTVLLQMAGPYLFSFGDWDNIIQYLSGFGMSYALWEYFKHHKKEIQGLKNQIHHLHEKLSKEETQNV